MKLLNIKRKLILIVMLSLFLPSVSTAWSFSFGSFSPFKYYPSINMPTPKNQNSDERPQINEENLAKKAIKQYIEERYEGIYKIGEIEDRGTHYLAEVFGSGGKVKEILVVDKQTAKIQSLK
jgi:hypothetical protein